MERWQKVLLPVLQSCPTKATDYWSYRLLRLQASHLQCRKMDTAARVRLELWGGSCRDGHVAGTSVLLCLPACLGGVNLMQWPLHACGHCAGRELDSRNSVLRGSNGTPPLMGTSPEHVIQDHKGHHRCVGCSQIELPTVATSQWFAATSRSKSGTGVQRAYCKLQSI